MIDRDKDRRIGVAAVLFASLVWGTTGTAATFAPEVSAAAIGAAAMGVGGLLQAMLASRGIFREIPALMGYWRLLLAGSLAVAIYPLAFYSSMRFSGVAVGTVVTIGSAPLFSALIEWIVDDVRPARRWLCGALLGIVGMTLLSTAERTTSSGIVGEGRNLQGIGLGLVGGLTYALYSWSARRVMLGGVRSSVAMGATFGIGGLFLMPVLISTGGPFLASWTNAAVGIYMATVPMFLGYLCFGIGLAKIPATLATTISLIEPVVAATLAILVVDERLPASGWVGVALVIACLVLITVPIRPSAATVRNAVAKT